MKTSSELRSRRLSRRELLKLSGLAVGGLALGGAWNGSGASSAMAQDGCEDGECACPEAVACRWDHPVRSQRYTYFDQLPPFYPFSSETSTTIPKLGNDEMRIIFMGSTIPNGLRRSQMMMSVFVEVGWDEEKQRPLDHFIFDCGSGVCTNYNSMNVGFDRMDKVFINHLHGDHMSDLTHIYCFGPSAGRYSPLYVWGPGPSGQESPPGSKNYYPNDGTKGFCEHLREACRWHTESFSFQRTTFLPENPDLRPLTEKWGLPYEPSPVSDDLPDDGYAMVPIELDWETGGVAYDNKDTGAKVSYFKVIHARKGSVGYKLEWTPPGIPGAKTISMIYSSDTKPEELCIENARNNNMGVDVFIHEMIVPAQVWAMKFSRETELPAPDDPLVQQLAMVQNSSHTPQGAFGYILSQIEPKPRLTVATHFPVSDDTVECAMKSVMEHCNVVQGRDPKRKENAARITWSFDCMVITVSEDRILEQRGVVSDFEYVATPPKVPPGPGTMKPAKYSDESGAGDPYAQLDRSTEIEACDCDTGECHYRADGY